MTCIDFNSILYDYGSEVLFGVYHERRSNCLFTDHGLPATTTFQVLRRSLSRRSSCPNLFLSRSVLLHEFCATDRARESSRHRSLPACHRSQAGIKTRVSRTTIAKANEQRDWKIYRDVAMILIDQARMLYARQPLAMNLKRAVYALDSTVIDLCLSLFPWAQHRRRKSAVKMHTQLDLRGNIPAFIHVTGGQTHDVHFLDHVVFEAGAFYVMDKAYTDFQRLYHLHQQQAFFVIRAKSNLASSRQASRPVDKSRGLRSDQTIRLTGQRSSVYYPERLRRVHYVDTELNKRFFYLTNNFTLSAWTITRLYKLRWQVELFFKWIKQHLRIKAFYGTTPNAVKTIN